MKELVITEKNAGGRLDKLVFKYLDKAGDGFVYKMLRKKNITLNDKKATGREILCAGDSVKLFLSDETIAKFKSGLSVKEARTQAAKRANVKKIPEKDMEAFRETIVFEDENILAVNKPAGLLSQKSVPEDVSLNDYVLNYVKGSDIFTPGISNRLDRNTSGLILAGKNLNATRILNEKIAERSISKKYLALVNGVIKEEKTVDGWLVKDEKTNKVAVVKREIAGASRIVTVYRPLADNGELTLTEVDLVTGKSHQIRAHLASEGHGIFGDDKYGNPSANVAAKEKYGLKYQFLHAYRMEFDKMEGSLEYLNGKIIWAPLPDKLITILKEEGLWQPGVPGVSEDPSLKK